MQQTAGGGCAGGRGFRGSGGGKFVHVFIVEGGDFLGFVFFGEGEVFFFFVANEVAFFVADDDVDENQFGSHVHAILRLGGSCWLLRLRRVLGARGEIGEQKARGKQCD